MVVGTPLLLVVSDSGGNSDDEAPVVLAVVLTVVAEDEAVGVGWTGDDFVGMEGVVACFFAVVVMAVVVAAALGLIIPTPSSVTPPYTSVNISSSLGSRDR